MYLTDGPAKGVLFADRIPPFLRAVIDADGTKDILDAPDDEARPSERIYVYVRIEQGGQLIWNGRDGTRRYPEADYIWLRGVDGEALRDNRAWQAWVARQPQPDPKDRWKNMRRYQFGPEADERGYTRFGI